ncbi:metallophosphoesterase family protein [Subtercola boreus]|uniref:Phosphoesterase n=1 Tax=Subtercola boreus TaxID=120213 RepID=A0A3E0W8P8_9MICO|nr:metallophosphoesterase [Subtercola boreus]RFA19786.1 YfcE family phosphodiesterase [Subtercola boreus]RFA19811.1 YfcE family phosphodiesterase [Subtercola boreus]RFA26206.1 YfcE family phosphodiesterase [Subtercola boreus]
MARLLFLADTHLPRRARDLPEEVWQAVDAADVVFHAGDWVDEQTLDRLLARVEAPRAGGIPRRFIGVWGNNDGPELRSRLPETARTDVAGLRFAMTHETGPATGREQRTDAAFPDTDVLVFGHSHIPWDTTTPAGMRLLNPGSPTDRRRQPFCTYLTATAASGALHDMTLHRLPPRPAQPRPVHPR